MIRTHRVDAGLDHLGNARGRDVVTGHFGPVSHADHAARGRNLAHQIVGKVAFDRAKAVNAAVADNHRHVRHRQHVAGHLGRRMRQVQHHAAPFDVGHDGAAKVGQAKVALAVQRPAQGVVEKVLQADDAVPRGLDLVQIGNVTLKRMRALDPQNATHRLAACGTGGQMGLKIRKAFDDGQVLGVFGGGLVQFFRLVQRALQNAGPGAHGPQLSNGQRRDVVKGVGRVFLVILTGGGFGHRRENLDRHAAFDQTRHVHLTPVAPFGDVAVPQQAVGVPVAHDHVVMQRAGRIGHGVGVMRHHRVAGAFDIARRKDEKARNSDHDKGGDDFQGGAHGLVLCLRLAQGKHTTLSFQRVT